LADDRFYVKTLRLRDFRCFKQVTLGPFDPHFNLLVGENGAGKSSILVALANNLRFIVGHGHSQQPPRLVGPSDINVMHQISADGRLTPIGNSASVIELDFGFRGNSFIAGEKIDSKDRAETISLINVFDIDSKHFFRTPINTPGIFTAFYTVNRRFGRAVEDIILSDSLGRAAFSNWSNAGLSNENLKEWLKDETLIELQRSKRSTDRDLKVSSGPLNIVSRALQEAVPGARLIEFDGIIDDIFVSFEDRAHVRFSQMSDGQRALIGLVGDLSRRICMLNFVDLGDKVLMDTPGVVFIDEIDLHLHPKWQRQIVPALKRIFPKIQFFATTHSPQVIGEAKPEEIVLLTKDGQHKRPSGSYGRDSNWILECVMEAEGRDPAIAARLKTLFDLIEDDKFDDARRAIKALRNDIGDGPETVGAEAYLWRLEHLGEEAAE
jgi:hypothetical protein